MSYPGLNTSSKVHSFKSVYQPTLMSRAECLALNNNRINFIQSVQGSIM